MQILKTKAARIAASIASAVTLVAAGTGISAAMASTPAAAPASNIYGCVTGNSRTLEHVFTVEKNFDNYLAKNSGKCPNGFPFTVETNKTEPPVTPTPTPTPTTPTPTPTTTAKVCTIKLGDSCQFEDPAHIPNSNGFNTYVINQPVGPQSGTTQTITATSPENWTMFANDKPYGYTGVQTFDAVQQLFNNWCGNGWGDCSNPKDTPLSSLASLKVNYAETSPHDANSIYEYAPDVWNDNYGDDVMFWVDTSPQRCTDNGLDSSDIIGQANIDGQSWTVYRYGSAGDEIMFILDGTSSTDPVKTGTCAQQSSGSINILAGFQWLVDHGFMTNLGMLDQLNTGWEVTSADNTTFTQTDYGISAPVKSS